MGRRYILKKIIEFILPWKKVRVNIFQVLLMKSSDILLVLELLF